MFDKIINPVTNKPVKLNGKLGRKILENYKKFFQQKGGSNFESSLSLKNLSFDNYQYGGRRLNNPENEVLNRSITINAHGHFSREMIRVPQGIEILLPHRFGHTHPYTTPDITGRSYEKELYETNGYFNYKRSSGGASGWKLYMPGDEISNIIFDPLGTTNCSIVDSDHSLQYPLIRHPTCKTGHQAYNSWCPLFATVDNTSPALLSPFKILQSPDGRNKLKIKCCSQFNLNDLISNLLGRLRQIKPELQNNLSPDPDNGNIVIIVFTCNAHPYGSPEEHLNEQLGVLDGAQESMGKQYNDLLAQKAQEAQAQAAQAAQAAPHPAAAAARDPDRHRAFDLLLQH